MVVSPPTDKVCIRNCVQREIRAYTYKSKETEQRKKGTRKEGKSAGNGKKGSIITDGASLEHNAT